MTGKIELHWPNQEQARKYHIYLYISPSCPWVSCLFGLLLLVSTQFKCKSLLKVYLRAYAVIVHTGCYLCHRSISWMARQCTVRWWLQSQFANKTCFSSWHWWSLWVISSPRAQRCHLLHRSMQTRISQGYSGNIACVFWPLSPPLSPLSFQTVVTNWVMWGSSKTTPTAVVKNGKGYYVAHNRTLAWR